jgi:2-polyprenyl-3-methyl-5-hydroxy-6-metoxy-1,4-benzoquinol methylase
VEEIMKQNFYNHKTCNICQSPKRKLIYKIGQQNLVECHKCKLRYLDTQRTDFLTLYNEDYYSSENSDETANYANYEFQEKVMEKNFHFAYDYVQKHGKKRESRLLEIGAGYGYFSKLLPRNILYEANEISEEAVNQMKKEKIICHPGDFSTIRFKGKYNFIVGFDVIEHQVDLKKFLEKIHSVLTIDGICIFTTPDFASLPNKVFGKNAPTIQPLYHNYYFDKKWLVHELPRLGFKVVSIRTSYTTNLSIGQIVLLGSFAVPFLKRFPIAGLLHKLHLENKTIPFFRFGGIECIMKRK